jgi:hypothetical protein
MRIYQYEYKGHIVNVVGPEWWLGGGGVHGRTDGKDPRAAAEAWIDAHLGARTPSVTLIVDNSYVERGPSRPVLMTEILGQDSCIEVGED